MPSCQSQSVFVAVRTGPGITPIGKPGEESLATQKRLATANHNHP